MKKILIILLSIILLVGCGKNNKQNSNNSTSKPKQEEKVYYTEEQATTRLKEIAEDIYKKQAYLTFTKENGKYFISLKDIKGVLKYDTKEVDNIKGLICDEKETGVSIDIDNKEKIDYYGAPVVVLTLCNPPGDNSNNEGQN